MSIWVPSPNYHLGRRKPLAYIVWHSTESAELRGGARNVAAGWFAKRESKVSAHIVVDNGNDPRYPDGVVECVKPENTAWHAAAANSAGYGIEIVGKANQSALDWSDPYSIGAVWNACRWIRVQPALKTIPARWLSDTQLRNGERGHTVHSQVSRVLGGTTHTDPGVGFPFAKVMELLGAGAASVPPDAPAGDRQVRALRVAAPLLHGDDVRDVQQGLNRAFPTYSHLVVDGLYGPGTASVVREFQSRTGLAADGVVGPATWSELAKHGIRV